MRPYLPVLVASVGSAAVAALTLIAARGNLWEALLLWLVILTAFFVLLWALRGLTRLILSRAWRDLSDR